MAASSPLLIFFIILVCCFCGLSYANRILWHLAVLSTAACALLTLFTRDRRVCMVSLALVLAPSGASTQTVRRHLFNSENGLGRARCHDTETRASGLLTSCTKCILCSVGTDHNHLLCAISTALSAGPARSFVYSFCGRRRTNLRLHYL